MPIDVELLACSAAVSGAMEVLQFKSGCGHTLLRMIRAI